jgi:SAM-dependent methyltransferase
LEAAQFFEVSGVEASHDAVQYCRDRGLEVKQGTGIDFGSNQPIDVLVMLDVIEHLAYPLNVLRSAHRNMNPGAHVVITTGDFDSFLSRIMRSSWRLMTPPQHLFFFSPRTIGKILERAGFRIVSLEHPSKRVPLDLAFFQFLRILGIKPKQLTTLKGMAIRINLFDAMRVIAIRE